MVMESSFHGVGLSLLTASPGLAHQQELVEDILPSCLQGRSSMHWKQDRAGLSSPSLDLQPAGCKLKGVGRACA